jgi:hypothetical protein
MANGDYDVKVLYRQNLPGAGFNTSGVAKQGKSFVVAYVSGTYQADANGDTLLKPIDVGLETFDFLAFDPEVFNSVYQASDRDIGAVYDREGQQLWLKSDVDGGTELGNGTTFVLRILAFGDTAANTELL